MWYTKKNIEDIIVNYEFIYDLAECAIEQNLDSHGRSFSSYNPWPWIEGKIDFDIALDKLGKGKWIGDIRGRDFFDFKKFGVLQRIIIAQIYDIDDYTLMHIGFYEIPRLRAIAYSFIYNLMNGRSIGERGRFQFETK